MSIWSSSCRQAAGCYEPEKDHAATDDVSRYGKHPITFLFKFVRQRWVVHASVLAAVVAAVGCSVSTQYGIKFLVDALADHSVWENRVWSAFGLLVVLIAADNLLWRLAGWIANPAFVGVTGDLRRDLFRHLMLPADSAMAFDDLGDCDSDICGGVFSVKSEYRPNLEFEHAIRPAPVFLPSA
jgi:hypothetical protein